MKKLFAFLSFLVAFAASAQEKPEGLFINSKAPEFRLKDQSGIEVSLKELRKKGQTVLIFYRGYQTQTAVFAPWHLRGKIAVILKELVIT